ncbi:MAG: pilus (MSHA type) biogenesis protein MshL [Gammaproteobacteria bacterium]|nr:pilus (MSHA type) biogenesis protein MshL [Gammaproteobacteria bacterium]
MGFLYRICWFLCCGVIAACADFVPEPPPPSAGHIAVPAKAAPAGDIPDIVALPPPLPQPAPLRHEDRYTVVVNEVPVRELLFALARDARINVDIAPGISGLITMNAVEQTLPQLLQRVARQAGLRYAMEDDNVFISPDKPYFQTYRVDYLNMERDTSHVVQVGTQIAGAGNSPEGGGGGGSNNSTTTIGTTMSNHFWANLVANVSAILDAEGDATASAVIPHPESGVLTVKATAAQHDTLRTLIDETLTNANRQVLIQATIVEVSLTDQFQAGIDWQALNQAGIEGLRLTTKTLTTNPVNAASLFSLSYEDADPGQERALSAAVELLQEFGDVRVLSSPQIMALNNQSAILKVVDNVVYFEVEQESNVTQGVAANTFETIVKTVPVGIVMTITPHIKADDSIILNIRPSISRINRFVNDPNPALAITSPVPEIRVREMESMLQLQNGEIAVMGGLMQDDSRSNDNAIPGLSRIPVLGAAFKMALREYEKTELVIFLRPLIVRNPSLDGDFSAYKQFFPGEDDDF